MPLRGEVFTGPLTKPVRGARVLDKEKADADREKDEAEIRKIVRRRDSGRCRIAVPHKCRGPLECIHIVDKSLGGDYTTANLILGCRWIHRQSAISIHQKTVQVVTETPRGADGPCQFYARDESGWFMTAREVAIHRLERD
jgi:hypothetical protein